MLVVWRFVELRLRQGLAGLWMGFGRRRKQASFVGRDVDSRRRTRWGPNGR